MKPREKSDETLAMARLEETSIVLHRFSIILAVVVFFVAMTFGMYTMNIRNELLQDTANSCTKS